MSGLLFIVDNYVENVDSCQVLLCGSGSVGFCRVMVPARQNW